MDKSYVRVFSKDKTQMVNCHMKVLTISSHQENANKNHNEVLSQSSNNPPKQYMLARMYGRRALAHCW